jgi:hypothetical protein
MTKVGTSRPRWRERNGRFLGVFCTVWRARWFLLTMLGSVLGGVIVPFVAGLGGYGFGAYLAVGVCLGFACLVAYFRPKSAILFVTVFTGIASAVNYWGRTAAGMRGAADLTVLWGIWAFLMGFSLPALVLGGLVGWSNRAFAERLRQMTAAVPRQPLPPERAAGRGVRRRRHLPPGPEGASR